MKRRLSFGRKVFRTLFWGGVFGVMVWSGKSVFLVVNADEEVFEMDGVIREVMIEDDGGGVWRVKTQETTVARVLEEQKVEVKEGDSVFPMLESEVFSGMKIFVDRKKEISLSIDGEVKKVETYTNTPGEFLREQGITMKEDDFLLPGSDIFLEDGSELEIVRVEVVEEKEYASIPFATEESEDDELGWQERKISQKGKEGKKEFVFRVVYHNGELVKKTKIGESVVEEPVTEKIVQGTYVKLGKKHTGYGTWYAHTGTMAAASPWLPMGSYAKVTNEANGKSVMVKINDRGPFGENRIIDLDKVAFEEIASLGAGVIEVKVEEVKN
jgi:uncharacterized protein YabE (DUF348 family)